jgi:hypothetical protein
MGREDRIMNEALRSGRSTIIPLNKEVPPPIYRLAHRPQVFCCAYMKDAWEGEVFALTGDALVIKTENLVNTGPVRFCPFCGGLVETPIVGTEER